MASILLAAGAFSAAGFLFNNLQKAIDRPEIEERERMAQERRDEMDRIREEQQRYSRRRDDVRDEIYNHGVGQHDIDEKLYKLKRRYDELNNELKMLTSGGSSGFSSGFSSGGVVDSSNFVIESVVVGGLVYATYKFLWSKK